jgi:hypothetical protein
VTAPTAQLVRNRRFWATRAALIVGAMALGLVLQHAVASRLAEIGNLAHVDVIRARMELAQILRIAAVAVFGLTGGTGLALLASSRRGLVEERFPPAGIFSWGAARIVTGPAARRLARVSLGLAVVIVACSAAGGALTWYMASVLLACKAR